MKKYSKFYTKHKKTNMEILIRIIRRNRNIIKKAMRNKSLPHIA